MLTLALFVFYVAVISAGSLALLFVLVVYGRKLIGSRAEVEPRIIQTARDHATRVSIDRLLADINGGSIDGEEEMETLLRALESSRPTSSKGVRVTVASSDEEAFLKLADEGQALLRREAKDV